jgi:Mg-chelatase subunit ChlD
MKNKTLKVLTLAVFSCGLVGGIFGQKIRKTKTVTTKTVTTKTVTTTVANDKKIKKETLEMVFVLDTTGSMGGLLEGAKQKIWSIINDVMKKESRPNVKVGLVAYRDRGDAYVTQIYPITEDLDKVYTNLMSFKAEGGGDAPENVRKALAEGVNKTGWSQKSDKLAQIIFLVGDAPPQTYQDEPDVLKTSAEAINKNMIVNTIQCGNLEGTGDIWRQIAQRGEGKFFAIAQDGGVQAISTPFDAKLAELGNKLGQSYVSYGGGEGKKGEEFRVSAVNAQKAAESQITLDGTESANADRAMNKVMNSRAYIGDLLQDIETNVTSIDQVKESDLPEDLKKLKPAERKKEIEKRLAERKKIREEIVALSKKRQDFIDAEKLKLGKQDGFDAAVSTALNEQLLKKGIK